MHWAQKMVRQCWYFNILVDYNIVSSAHIKVIVSQVSANSAEVFGA